jgi:biotin operon repressor
MTADEVNKVIRALRRGGIDIVEVHNHMLNDQPRLFYLHFWTTGDGTRLAKAIRPALDATNLAKPTA